jgi:hypothetical protein
MAACYLRHYSIFSLELDIQSGAKNSQLCLCISYVSLASAVRPPYDPTYGVCTASLLFAAYVTCMRTYVKLR